ncbi:MAG: hypothetical protein ACLUUO_12485 [Sellimonas intestinalis]
MSSKDRTIPLHDSSKICGYSAPCKTKTFSPASSDAGGCLSRKIFSPFAALRDTKKRLPKRVEKRHGYQKELSEEDIRPAFRASSPYRSGMTVTVRYFQEDTVHPASPPLGIFCELTGRVERIDPAFQTLHLSDGTVRTDIRFEDLDDIDIL